MNHPRATHSGRSKIGDADVFVHILHGGQPVIEIASIGPLLGLSEGALGEFLAGLPGGGGRVHFRRSSEECTACKAPASHEVGGVPRCGGCAKGAGHLNLGPMVDVVGVPADDVPNILTAYMIAHPETTAAQKAQAILTALSLRDARAFAKRLAKQGEAAPRPPEFVNGKRIHLPKDFNLQRLCEEHQRFVGYTGDGHVAFTEEARAIIAAGEITCEMADVLFREMIDASSDARKIRDEAEGLNQWIARPLGGGLFEVTHRGRTGRFRPITNGKRRSLRYANPANAPKGQRCTVCRREMPEGATMYVFDRGEERRNEYDPIADHFRHHRACESCMRPELQAAVMGAALLGKAES